MSKLIDPRALLIGAVAARPPYLPPLLLWTLAFIVGAALSLAGATLWTVLLAVLAATVLSAASSAHAYRASRHRTLHAALILLAPVLLAVGFGRAEATKFDPDSLAAVDLAGQPVQLEGVLAADPQLHAGGLRLRLESVALQLGDERRVIDDAVQLQTADALTLHAGDRIAARAALSPTAAATDDYLLWLANQRIAAAARAVPGSVRIVARERLSFWQQAAADARAALNQSLRHALPPPYSGIAQGMITGRRDGIDSELRETLNDTSLSHLIVISGSNLTLLTALAMSAFAWLIGRRPAAALAIIAALAYGALIGPDPPVQRAMWMAVVFASAHLLGRGASALYAVTATAGLMIGLEPSILLDISFQLTLAGTLGIVLLMPALSRDFLSGQRGITGTIRDAALVTLVASLATMPLIVLHFERAALIGIPANLLAAPLFAWMLLGSAAAAVVGLLSETAAAALAWPLAWLPLRWLVIVAEQTVQLPGAGTPVQGFTHVHLLIIYAAVLVAAVRPHRERVRRWFRTPPAQRTFPQPLHAVGLDLVPNLRAAVTPAALTAIASAAAAALWLSACAAPPQQLRVHFIDVGQGDAALIVTPQGQSILIDTGEQPDALLAALRTHLPARARAIDHLIISHPQSDHGEALWALTEYYNIGQAYVSRHFGSTAFGRRAAELLERHTVPTTVLQAGDQIVLDGAPPLQLDVLWPPTRPLPDHYLADPNATSLVIRARYGGAAFLFSGDVNAEQELDLVRLPCPGTASRCELRADVLKVAHQGSRFSSTTLFLEAVRPTLAILSAGADNPHGHPHESVVASLERIGALPLLTAQRGDLSVATDGRAISLTTER